MRPPKSAMPKVLFGLFEAKSSTSPNLRDLKHLERNSNECREKTPLSRALNASPGLFAPVTWRKRFGL